MPRTKIHRELTLSHNGKRFDLYRYHKADKGFYQLHLAKILGLLEQIDEEVYVIRPIIHLNQIAERNTYISTLIMLFKKAICKQTRLEYTEIKYAWCRELGEDLTWHYHTVLFLPKQAFKCETYTPRALLEQVHQELKEKKEMPASLVWPEDIIKDLGSPFRQALNFYNPGNLSSFRYVFKILSYYAKVESKDLKNNGRNFGASLRTNPSSKKAA